MPRVLDLEHSYYHVTQEDIRNVGLFHHLKYLSVGWGSYIHSIPASIGNLRGLQTLHLRNSHIDKLPAEVTKLQSLRILRCSNRGVYYYFDIEDDMKDSLVNALKLPLLLQPCADRETRAEVVAELHRGFSSCSSSSGGVKVPKGIGRLKELQILQAVDIGRSSQKAVHELRQLTQLRKLAVAGVTKRKFRKLSESLQKLSALRSLELRAEPGERLPLDKLYSTSPPPLLSLKLEVRIAEVPVWVGKLVSLVKIQLIFTYLEGAECLRIVGELRNLACLRLHSFAYSGEELIVHREAFPKLIILELERLETLIKVTFEEGTSQKLENITIRDCRTDLMIYGINSLQNLKEILHFTDYYKLVKVDRPQKQAEQNRTSPHLRDANVSEETQKPEASLQEQGESSQSRLEPDAATIKLMRSQSCPSTASAR